MNGISEAVRLVRGTAGNLPVEAADVVVTAGTGVPADGPMWGVDK